MKHFKILILFIITLTLSSCEIVQEVNFNTDKSGKYSLGLDLSEMMKMGMKSDKDSNNEQIDTLIVFSDYLELKKDSISKLSKKEQEKIKQLEGFSLYMNSDTIEKRLVMKMNYEFKDLNDLAQFGEKLKGQNIKELDVFNKNTKKSEKTEDNQIFDFNDSFKTVFNKSKFSLKITPEALKKSESKKDTTMTKDNPMADLIRFKMKYTFPYRIKKVSNENAKISSDFKGIEFSANLFEVNNDPKYFDVEVEFEEN